VKGLDHLKGLDHTPHGAEVDEILEEVVTARRTGTDPKELFGGPRDWIDSGLPPAAFVIANFVASLRTAIYVALAVGAVIVVIRLARRETLRHAFSGAVGLAISAFIAAKTGDARNFFVVGIVTNVVYGLAFLVSVLVRHPIVGVIMRVFLEKYPKEWHEHPKVKRAYAEVTLGWAGMFLVRFAVQSLLYQKNQVGLLAVAKISMGYPLFLLALAVTLPYVRRRTRDVPVPESAPEGDAEAGGEDAAHDAAQAVPDGSGA
jgi:hypothetical protein